MFYVFLAISLLFLIAIVFRQITKISICVICVSIATTWIALFILYKTGSFHDIVLLSLLMGQSISGLFYLLQKNVPASLRIFTLPFFLTFTAIFYFLITTQFVLLAFVLLSVLWVLAWLVFVYRNDPGKKSVAKAMMDCCGGDE